jgi:hypothetical protein
MAAARRKRSRERKGIWVPDCEEQFQTLRALTGATPPGRASRRDDLDPEFDAWLEAFPND